MPIRPFQLERFFARYEFNAEYLLCSSDSEALSVGDLLDMETGARERFEKQWLGYTESQGNPELREAICELYGTVSPDHILVHAGAEEAIFNFMHVALQPGDHVIVHFPCYQSLAEIARSIGCEVTYWETCDADQWELDVNVLRNTIRENTKAIIVNCPHNPTGYLMSREKQQQIVEIAKAQKIWLFSDEVYRFSEYDPADRLPAACDVYDYGVSLGVMSKSFGLAGLRIGWIATRNAELYAKLAGFKDYTSICNSAPSEFLALLALRHRDQVLGRNMAIIQRNLGLLMPFFERHRDTLQWVKPKAGAIAFPRLQQDIDTEAFCIRLVEKKGVLLLPGSYYDFGTRHFRLGFGRQNMPAALERLESYLLETVTSLPGLREPV